MKRFAAIGIVAGSIALTTPVVAQQARTTTSALDIQVVSTRPELVTGGDVLLQIAGPANLNAKNVVVRANGKDVSSVFKPAPGTRGLVGRVDGLNVGTNAIVASMRGSKATAQLAVELVAEIRHLDRRITGVNTKITEAVQQSGSTLTDLVGVGTLTAGKILARVGDVHRFRTPAAFASYTGTAPIEASSGDVVRHRLSRAGDRQLNCCLHIAAITQIRLDGPGRTYYQRKRADGKSHKEALRCLKRRLSDIVYRQLLKDAGDRQTADLGGHQGATTTSSAAGTTPTPTLRTSHFPGPPMPTLQLLAPAT